MRVEAHVTRPSWMARALSSVTGALIRKLPPASRAHSERSAAGVENDSAADLIAVESALAQVNRARRIDELDRACVVIGRHAVRAAERDLTPVGVFLTMTLTERLGMTGHWR